MSRPTEENLRKWGASLREIDPSMLAEDDEGPVRWFLGDNATELFVWVIPGQPPHHIQLVFARVSVEWEMKKGLSTGSFSSNVSTMGGRYDPYLLNVAHAVDPEVCRAALTLLGEARVDSNVVATLVRALEGAVGSLGAVGK